MLSQRRSIRLPEFDYAQAGYYFVTLLAYHRNPIFGNINPSGEVVLNSSGKIAFYEWKNLKRDLKIELDDFVIMPNHIHGILILTQQPGYTGIKPEKGLQPGSIGMIVGQYKSQVTRLIRKNENDNEMKVWHRNYFEHIIRTENALQRIRQYILENPLHWAEDKFHN